MARPLRIEYPSAVYHVLNRGNDRRRVFHSVKYYELFLDKLEQFAGKYEVDVRNWCLMPNHFHLQICTPHGNLGRFMQSFLTSYTIVANRWRKSSGHVFQGRYKAWLIEDEKYGSVLSRYIHLNPVRVKKIELLPLEEQLETLYGYRWSSFPALAGEIPTPAWMDSEATLQRWGQDRTTQMTNYRKYVEEGLGVSLASPLADAVSGAILGDERFVEKVRRAQADQDVDVREQPGLRELTSAFEPEEVIAAVARVYGIDSNRIVVRRGCHREARRAAIYCTDKFCRALRTQAEMSTLFHIGLGAYGSARSSFENIRPVNPDLDRIVDEVKNTLKTNIPEV